MKRSSKKGFTLAELLIVIAIIAILVAVMFPVFGDQLNKARAAAELANVRAKYSELVADAMLGGNNLTGNPANTTITIPTNELLAAMKYTGATLECTSGTGSFDPSTGTYAKGTNGWVEVTYKGFSGRFETDSDVIFDSQELKTK